MAEHRAAAALGDVALGSSFTGLVALNLECQGLAGGRGMPRRDPLVPTGGATYQAALTPS